jgi:hypothetical protein
MFSDATQEPGKIRREFMVIFGQPITTSRIAS